MGFFRAVAAFFGAIGSLFGFLKSRSDANNAPDVKAAAKKQQEADAKDKIRRDIATGDLDAQRRDWSD